MGQDVLLPAPKRARSNISRPPNYPHVPPAAVDISTPFQHTNNTTRIDTSADTSNSDLGKLVKRHSQLLSSLPWVEFVHQVRGRSCIAPLVSSIPHRAAPVLEDFRRAGVPILSTDPEWSPNLRSMATARGCHKSALEFGSFVHDDMADMVTRGYWVVLPYSAVSHLPNLRISPIGCVPQRERRPRIIVDYTYSGVNATTDRCAYQEAMQFGGTLKRLLQQILLAKPEHGPVFALKIDLSDGFYRVPLRPSDVPRLGVVLPPLPDSQDDIIAFPLTLPMGWTESPPQFTAFTETITDLANRLTTEATWDPPPHPLELSASTQPTLPKPHRPVVSIPPPSFLRCAPVPHLASDILASLPRLPANPPLRFVSYTHNTPLAYTDVYLDDEIVLAQGSRPRLNRLRRTLLHCNDPVSNDAEDSRQGRREPISAKKLSRGDACWTTFKTILGWNVDTLQKTVELPPHRKTKLLSLLDDFRHRQTATLLEWQKLLGELRYWLEAYDSPDRYQVSK